MIRTVHVISSIDSRMGGPTTALFGLARAQRDVGLDVSVIATHRADEDLSRAVELREQGIPIRLVGPGRGPLVNHPELKSAVGEAVGNADVIHIHALWEEIQHLAARAARRANKPYLIRPCGMLDPWSLGQSRWKKRLYLTWRLRSDLNHAAALHFTAEQERDLTRPMRLKARALVEPNGIDLSEFADLPAAGLFRASHPQIADRPLLLFLSRVHPKKGLDLLIPAFAQVQDPRAMLVIAGPDAEGHTAPLQAAAAKLGIGDRVLFTGMLHGRDRIAALRDADLFVLPSRQENFGISVVEAMAAGRPVIISDQVNIFREVMGCGAGAAIPLDLGLIAAELNRWLPDEPRRRAAGEKGRAFVRMHYDWRAIAARWAGHYQSMLVNRPAAGQLPDNPNLRA